MGKRYLCRTEGKVRGNGANRVIDPNMLESSQNFLSKL